MNTQQTLKAERLTPRQAAIIGAFTGVLCGAFSDLQSYAEEVLGRPIWTHEFGNDEMGRKLKLAATDDFMAIYTAPPNK